VKETDEPAFPGPVFFDDEARNGIVTAGTPWVAAQDAVCGKVSSPEKAMHFQGIDSIR